MNKEFRLATISVEYEKVDARYDSYKDAIEYKSDKEVRILRKESQFNRIEFTNSDDVIILASFDGKTSGYYFLLEEGEVSLFKEIRTKFIHGKIPTSSYGSPKAAEFKTSSPEYYIQIGSFIVKELKDVNEIIEILPEKKLEITSFVKENKIKFNMEQDLIRFVQFLNK